MTHKCKVVESLIVQKCGEVERWVQGKVKVVEDQVQGGCREIGGKFQGQGGPPVKLEGSERDLEARLCARFESKIQGMQRENQELKIEVTRLNEKHCQMQVKTDRQHQESAQSVHNMNLWVQKFVGQLKAQEQQVQRLESQIVEGLKLAKGTHTDLRTFQDRVVEVVEDVRRNPNGRVAKDTRRVVGFLG